MNAVPSRVEGSHGAEVAAGERFEFGKNWSRFLANLDDSKIAAAQATLANMLQCSSLDGLSFLDVGSGSGLSSLAAYRLGARVHSFDFDPHSVACTTELRRRFASDSSDRWVVEEGSVLDRDYLRRLGKHDIVYSWGVLHHTGRMWDALDNAQALVRPGGSLFIAIYNDEGTRSVRWRWIKRTYNRLPSLLRPTYSALVSAPGEIKTVVRLVATGRIADYLNYSSGSNVNERGMTRWRDIIDWVGGYPYEVATPDEIFDFHRARGFVLTKLRCGRVGSGCNEFVFHRPG
jgi:2-polyprenyl-6-hydroxyphenyl methylase/3-demethylubiquinone-9 3-methyltransferase